MASRLPDPTPSFAKIQMDQCAGTSETGMATSQPVRARSHAEIEQLTRAIINLRRKRDELFRPGLFGEPAWDMLLELLLAKLTFRRECVSSLCIASAVPATTAIRWIDALEGQGLVARRPDHLDRRRHFVILTEKGQCALEEFFNLPQFDVLCANPLHACASNPAATSRESLRRR